MMLTQLQITSAKPKAKPYNLADGQPKPMFDTIVNVSHDSLDIIDGNVLHGASGSIAETCMRVVESVYGYTVGGKPMPYRELSKTNARMKNVHREFGTTGIVLRIDQPWFKGFSENQMAARRTVARVLSEMLARDRSIATADVSWAHSGISIYSGGSPCKLDDAIVIYDNVQGGLRLTSPLFSELSEFIELLSKAVELAGSEALLSEATVVRLMEWHATLGDAPAPSTAAVEHGDDAPNASELKLWTGAIQTAAFAIQHADDQRYFPENADA
jgi:DEAD/DEAH box helicase domain-containing protein